MALERAKEPVAEQVIMAQDLERVELVTVLDGALGAMAQV
jgi:hypothetical protein